MSFRLVLNCLYLAALLLCCGVIYSYATQFSGQMVVAVGASERVVLREAQGAFLGPHRAVPPALLPLSDPRVERLLDPDQAYDGAILPFHLRLDNIEILTEFPPQDVLEWEMGRHTDAQVVEAGDTVCFDGPGCVDALGVVSWSGLLFQPGGAPMISVRFRQDALETRHMIETGRQVMINGMPLYFQWYPDAEAAREAMGEELPDAIQTRWGVEDGGAITWMNQPSPGQGMTTRDGREWTVLTTQLGLEAPPSLTLELRQNGQQERVVLRPGENPAHGLHFDAPRHAPRSFVVHGYPDQEVYLGEYRQGRRYVTTVLTPGGDAMDLGDGNLLLEQTLAAAIPIVAEDNAIVALEVLSEKGRHILREGDRLPWQGGFLIYRRKPAPPDVACNISALKEGETIASGRMTPGQWMRIENWYFRIASARHAPQMLFLEAQRSGFARPSTRIGLGLFVLGAFGLVIVRFYRRPGKIRRTTDNAN